MTAPLEPQVREATDADHSRWNAYLDSVPATSPLARYEWRAVLSSVYGVPTRFLIAERAGRVTGVLGGYEVVDFLGVRRFYSLRAGAAADDEASAAAMRDRLEEEGVTRGWREAVLTSGDRAWGGLQADFLKKTVQVDIDEDEEEMWSGLRDKTRNMVRRAERNGVVVASGPEHVHTLYRHYRDNMSRLGVTFHVPEFFAEIVGRLGRHAEILVAMHEGRPIASMLLLLGRDFACYPVQNVSFDARSLAPIQRLNWEAMKLCGGRGIRRLDMGESRESSPVYRSKVNFGGRPQDLHYYGLARCDAQNDRSGSLSRTMGRALLAGITILRRAGPGPIRPYLLQVLHRRGRLV